MNTGSEFLTEIKVSTPKRNQKKSSLISSIAERMEQEIYENCLYDQSVSLNFEYASGTIEISMTNADGCEVSVIHTENEHCSPTLEAAIARSMPDWWGIQLRAEEDRRNEIEFKDYLWCNCRYL